MVKCLKPIRESKTRLIWMSFGFDTTTTIAVPCIFWTVKKLNNFINTCPCCWNCSETINLSWRPDWSRVTSWSWITIGCCTDENALKGRAEIWSVVMLSCPKVYCPVQSLRVAVQYHLPTISCDVTHTDVCFFFDRINFNTNNTNNTSDCTSYGTKDVWIFF